MSRENYVSDKNLYKENEAACVYFGNGMVAMGFVGRRSKPEFNYRFRSEADREKYSETFLTNWMEWTKEKRARKAAEKIPHSFKVGDIFDHTWGYEQTNVQFYEVVAVTKKSITLREIESTVTENGFMCGTAVPVPGEFVKNAKDIRKLNPAKDGFSMRFGWASPWDGNPVRCSWYG